MKNIYLLPILAIIIALSSCSSAYKSGQTPDDVYYSPGRQRSAAQSSDNQDEYYSANTNDQYLMMRVQNPDSRWSTFDDYDYGYAGSYSPYTYGYSSYGLYGGFSPWLSFGMYPYSSYYGFGYMNYYAWNCFHNPYYGGPVVISNNYVMYNSYNQLHPFNMASYSNRVINNSNVRNGRFYTPSATTRNTNSAFSNNFRNNSNSNNYYNNNRRSFYNNQNNNNSNLRQSNTQPTRSFTPSPSFGSGNSGGNMSRGGGVSRH